MDSQEPTGSCWRSETEEERLQMISFHADQPPNKRSTIWPSGLRLGPVDGQRRRADGKESVRMEECKGIIKRVLTDDEVAQLKDLFAIVKRDGPKSNLLGVVDLTESPECAACSFRLSWGYTTYCENPEKLSGLKPGMETQP
jgi:hypothetical protein